MKSWRLLFLSCLLIHSSAAASELRATWLGIAGLAISDGETTLLFDPTFTRPHLKHWLFNQPFRANPERVKAGLKAASIDRAEAIFVSHTHFDHAVDVDAVAQLTRASVLGGASVEALISSQREKIPFQNIEDGKPLQIGAFTVIPHRRTHAAIFHSGWHFLPGPWITREAPRFYDYREGETWFYRVEHPSGRILVDQASQLADSAHPYEGKTDTYFVGVANRASLEDLVKNNILRIAPTLLVPIHFDFFLLQSDFLEKMRLPGVKLEEIAESLPQKSMTYRIPTRYEPFTLPLRKPSP